MRRLLLVSALTVAAFAGPAHADPSICTIRGCISEIGEKACGQEGCGPVARCHWWTDEPICLY
jgi:hypothetical protein